MQEKPQVSNSSWAHVQPPVITSLNSPFALYALVSLQLLTLNSQSHLYTYIYPECSTTSRSYCHTQKQNKEVLYRLQIYNKLKRQKKNTSVLTTGLHIVLPRQMYRGLDDLLYSWPVQLNWALLIDPTNDFTVAFL